MHLNKSLKARLAAIRLVSLDVDGVLTDGGLYYAEDGRELRKFDVKDGLGIKRLLSANIPVAVVTASTTRSIAVRCRRLGIPHVALGVEDKPAALRKICRRLNAGLVDVVHIADDINDLPLLRLVGVSVAVADAMPEVRKAVDCITTRRGGNGAVRELCDTILQLRTAGR